VSTEYLIVGKLDPSGVTTGAQKVKQDLKGVDNAAASTKKAINTAFDQGQFDKSIGSLVTRFESLEKTMTETARTSTAVATSNASLIKSLDSMTLAAGKAGNATAGVAKGTAAAAAGNDKMAGSLRRVLQAVDEEAAEMAKLNSLLAEAHRLKEAGIIDDVRLAQVQKLVADGVDKSTVSIGQQRAGYTQLGFQVQDTLQTLSLGINPLVVLAQQGGQTASALSLALGTAGTAGKVATFIAGPWGSLILAGTTVLGMFAYKAYQATSALDEAVKKLKEDAKETEVADRAKVRYARSSEGVAAAIREGTKATKESIDATRTSAEAANIAAKTNLEREISIRKVTLAELEQAKVLAENARPGATGGGPGGAASLVAAQYAGRVEELAKRAKAEQAGIVEAEKRVQQTRLDLALELSDKQSTAVGRVTLEYDRQISALERTIRIQIQAGKVVDSATTRQLTQLRQRRDAAIEAQQAAERLEKSDAKAGPLTTFINPTEGRVTSGFGPRRAPTAGASTFHRGIDIAAPAGTAVKAAAGGVIVHAGKLGGLGNAIIVDHGGGTITEYGHLSSVLVQRGQRVGQGQQIGGVGNTGISTGAHLDYRVKVGGRYVDPRKGRFRTDETATEVRAARTEETAAEKAARKAEQERDFVAGVEDQAATRGIDGRADTLDARIARQLAEFKRRFDREAGPDETRRITSALTDADARETANRFDQAYVQPLQRLRAIQGVTGQDRAIMNAKLEETTRLGRELTPVEAQMIESSIRQGDALTRQVGILEAVRQPVQEYHDQIAALQALLARGAISQDQFNRSVQGLGTTASQFKAGLPGNDNLGRNFADQGAREQADRERADELGQLSTFLDQGTILYAEAAAVREAIERKHADTLRNIDYARRDIAIGAAQSTSESLLSIAEDSVGKQSAVYKGLFITSKAFAIADSVIKIQQGIANALSLPFPANIAAVATVAAQAASIVSNIQAISLNFADGGKVRGPGGPRDDAIKANLSDGEFVVNAAAVARPGNEAMLEAMNSGAVTAGLRRANNDNAATARITGGGVGDSYTMSFGDVIVQTGSETSGSDGRQIGRDVKAALTSIVREEIAAAKRPGGQLTNTRQSVMNR
jgi:murein DD-endopeptidase MepM/ murein hydrolase activator NlpD